MKTSWVLSENEKCKLNLGKSAPIPFEEQSSPVKIKKEEQEAELTDGDSDIILQNHPSTPIATKSKCSTNEDASTSTTSTNINTNIDAPSSPFLTSSTEEQPRRYCSPLLFNPR